MQHIEITNIKWEKDGDSVNLPECVVILEYSHLKSEEEIEELIADALSNNFGYLHDGFDWSFKDTFPAHKSVVMKDEIFIE